MVPEEYKVSHECGPHQIDHDGCPKGQGLRRTRERSTFTVNTPLDEAQNGDARRCDSNKNKYNVDSHRRSRRVAQTCAVNMSARSPFKAFGPSSEHGSHPEGRISNSARAVHPGCPPTSALPTYSAQSLASPAGSLHSKR